ncbi:hypothetical protein AB0E69_38680 [Kribbella sp. NPDC026611]|uniref:hypothetical protein n=1 Tax=Kribbella sp. NPDC026611 TaxID=3154911 RepID=UPI0033F5A2C0
MSWRSVEELRDELPAVLVRFRAGQTRAFSFGNGGPDAVVLTYEEFEDIEGWDRLALPDEVVSPEVLAARLDEIVAGGVAPVVWGENGQAEAIVMSAAQYRRLRGDHQPPPGVMDDPTRTIYASEPLPDSRPLDLDEWAAQMGPETQALLEELRREGRDGS